MSRAEMAVLAQEPVLVERLRAAGVLQGDAEDLKTTASWQDDMLRAFEERGADPLRLLLQDSLLRRFPQADASELGQMAHIMFIVEAQEAGCTRV